MSDGLHDNCFEDDYNTSVRKDLMDQNDLFQSRLNYFEQLDYHLSSETLVNLLETTAKLYHKYKLLKEETNQSKQQKYVSDIKKLIYQFNEIVPDKEIKEQLTIKNLENYLNNFSPK